MVLQLRSGRKGSSYLIMPLRLLYALCLLYASTTTTCTASSLCTYSQVSTVSRTTGTHSVGLAGDGWAWTYGVILCAVGSISIVDLTEMTSVQHFPSAWARCPAEHTPVGGQVRHRDKESAKADVLIAALMYECDGPSVDYLNDYLEQQAAPFGGYDYFSDVAAELRSMTELLLVYRGSQTCWRW